MSDTQAAYRSARQRIRLVGSELDRVDQRTRAVAVDHPFLLLGGAVLFGYVCGRVLRNL